MNEHKRPITTNFSNLIAVCSFFFAKPKYFLDWGPPSTLSATSSFSQVVHLPVASITEFYNHSLSAKISVTHRATITAIYLPTVRRTAIFTHGTPTLPTWYLLSFPGTGMQPRTHNRSNTNKVYFCQPHEQPYYLVTTNRFEAAAYAKLKSLDAEAEWLKILDSGQKGMKSGL